MTAPETTTARGSTHRRRSRASGRPRGADSAARRDQILAEAARLFSVDGYRGTSMTRVAQAAGISYTGLAHYFATKDELLQAVLDRRDELDIARFFACDEEPPTGWEYLRRMVALTRNNEQQPGMVRLFATISGEAVDPEHPANAWLRRHHEATLANLRAALDEAVRAGELDPQAPTESMARLLVAAMDGLQTQWLCEPGARGMAEDVEVLVDTFERRWRP